MCVAVVINKPQSKSEKNYAPVFIKERIVNETESIEIPSAQPSNSKRGSNQKESRKFDG
jgi:hypothetical protein